jgi:hypothetical protein
MCHGTWTDEIQSISHDVRVKTYCQQKLNRIQFIICIVKTHLVVVMTFVCLELFPAMKRGNIRIFFVSSCYYACAAILTKVPVPETRNYWSKG